MSSSTETTSTTSTASSTTSTEKAKKRVVEKARIRKWNKLEPNKDKGRYACDRANTHGVPLLACFGVTQGDEFSRFASERHYAFMLEGLQDLQRDLAERKIKLVLASNGPVKTVLELSKEAVETVVDLGYLKVQRKWYADVADQIKCPFTQIESNVVVPVDLVTDKEEYAARTIRNKIWKHASGFLKPLEEVPVKCSSLNLHNPDFAATLDYIKLPKDEGDIQPIVDELNIDTSVSRVDNVRGGYSQARNTLDKFIESRLKYYANERNAPGKEFQSYLSAYLHFGHISPVEIILAVSASKAADKASKDSFIEELMVRRELAMNFVWFNDHYDSIKCVPDWAKKTMKDHAEDKRKHLYSEEELEQGRTHDRFWNACQLEMVHTGRMHGYMRMYWGKKVIEWTPDHKTAYKLLIKLNDKYELDGRDPNGYTGIAWCFGKHDQGWAERPIFGKLRYMNDEGLLRKYRDTIERYVQKYYKLAGRTGGEPPAKKKKK